MDGAGAAVAVANRVVVEIETDTKIRLFYDHCRAAVMRLIITAIRIYAVRYIWHIIRFGRSPNDAEDKVNRFPLFILCAINREWRVRAKLVQSMFTHITRARLL